MDSLTLYQEHIEPHIILISTERTSDSLLPCMCGARDLFTRHAHALRDIIWRT